ncbi:AIM24 family protein [Solibacillus silvestris]|uniref:AIM24 family protein n=1 Tax=Solibacillus silvestris TaxID=76853 RepID=UPI003F810DEA
MSKYTIEEFVKKTAESDEQRGYFELETDRLLEVNLTDLVWTKMGAMIAYEGSIKFEREKLTEHGIGNMFKKALTGEGTQLMKASGKGKLYLADKGKKIILLNLQSDDIFVNGNDLLAFEPSVKHEVKMMRKVAGMMAGGLFNVKCSGTGLIAITSHYEPLTLRVTPGKPVFTDPNATIAWSGNLTPNFHTDISFRTMIGRGSGESIQMKFEGDGFVIVQPYEETYYDQTNN